MVCPYSLSVPGGVQAQVLGLSARLRTLGHEVRVLGPCDGPPPTAYVTPLGDSLPTAANGSFAPLAPDPPATMRTYRALRDEEFDVVHVHEPLAPGPSIASVTIQPSPLVGTFHAAGRSSSYRILAPALRPILGRLDHRVAVSKDALALVQSHLGGDYEVLFNGVDVMSIQAASTIPTERPAVLFIGRHEERKGLGVLLAAVGAMSDDLSVWVAGVGPDTERLREQYRDDDRIEWLGRIDENEKLTRLKSATVFCAPSLHGESFGVVLAEAMAARTAVVASALAGYQNVAADGVNSLLVAPGDPSALADALTRLLHDPDLASALIERGTERAEQLSMSRLADRYLAIYESISH